jgi:hypothetical protein
MDGFRSIRNQSEHIKKQQLKNQLYIERTRKLCLKVGWLFDSKHKENAFLMIYSRFQKRISLLQGVMMIDKTWCNFNFKQVLYKL